MHAHPGTRGEPTRPMGPRCVAPGPEPQPAFVYRPGCPPSSTAALTAPGAPVLPRRPSAGVLPSFSIIPPARSNRFMSAWIRSLVRPLGARFLLLNVFPPAPAMFVTLRLVEHQRNTSPSLLGIQGAGGNAAWARHLELATYLGSRFVDGTTHVRCVKRNTPTFIIPRHDCPAVTVTASQVRRHVILRANGYQQAATNRITT